MKSNPYFDISEDGKTITIKFPGTYDVNSDGFFLIEKAKLCEEVECDKESKT